MRKSKRESERERETRAKIEREEESAVSRVCVQVFACAHLV